MPDINISVQNKIAVQTNKTEYICDNSDFIIKFNFDAEWDAYDTKTARFCYNSKYVDAVFTGDSCAVPIISDTNDINIGVYAGNLHTTTPALVLCEKSILGGSGFPADPPDDVYNQIMELIQGLGTPDAEAIAKAVADYLIEHPLEETDPTVPTWAKAEKKPTYTAEEVGAIANTELQTAINSALAQAKASGEFDGADGTTPHIGDNGNWYLGDTDTGKPSRGEAGAGMVITGATVGQIAKITAVDDSGKPTAWEAVDMPSGGGSNWVKVYDGSNTIAEEISAFEVDLTKSDHMKEFQLWLKLDKNTAEDWGANKNIEVSVNGETIGYFILSSRLNTYTELYVERSLEAMNVTKRCISFVGLNYNTAQPFLLVDQLVRLQNNGKLSIHFPAPYAGKITAKVYGRY